MVKCQGPHWWVKIADFGISKRALEGRTALRTQTGTPTFQAPETLGFIKSSEVPDGSYTNAVDIWSVGVITFYMLTHVILFPDPGCLSRYVTGDFQFPSDKLLANEVSEQGYDFIKSLMAPKSKNRPAVKECLQHLWLNHLIEDPETQGYYIL